MSLLEKIRQLLTIQLGMGMAVKGTRGPSCRKHSKPADVRRREARRYDREMRRQRTANALWLANVEAVAEGTRGVDAIRGYCTGDVAKVLALRTIRTSAT